MKQRIYNNRNTFRLISLLILIAGGIFSYLFYGQEPHETIGGFLVGAGLAMLLIFITIKHPEDTK